eukprot:5529778-Amphidinium_carterae.1
MKNADHRNNSTFSSTKQRFNPRSYWLRLVISFHQLTVDPDNAGAEHQPIDGGWLEEAMFS